MQLDKSLLCSNQQAITATAVSTDAVDLGAAGREIGTGRQLFAVAHVMEAFTASGAATLTVDLIEADDAALTSNVDALSSSGAIPKATLVVGYKVVLPVPPRANVGGQRYHGFRYTVATGPMTAGKVTSHFTTAVERANTYPSGLNTSGM